MLWRAGSPDGGFVNDSLSFPSVLGKYISMFVYVPYAVSAGILISRKRRVAVYV